MLEELPSPLLATDPRVVLVRSRDDVMEPPAQVRVRERADTGTVSALKMLLVMWIGLLVAVVLVSPGLVHIAMGMSSGIPQTVVLNVGETARKPADALQLTQPWYHLVAALGYPEATPSAAMLGQTSSAPPTPRPSAQPRVTPVPAIAGSHHRVAASPTPVSSPTVVHPAIAVSHLHAVTRKSPLRLLITGDSLPGYLGPQLLSNLSHRGSIVGWTDVHDGTGLTRPDFVDWSVLARQQVGQYHPDAVVVLMGGNDFQNMVVRGNRVLYAGTPAWRQEYERRALVCMRIWAQNGSTHRVYWLSLPPARDAGWAFDDRQINIALQAAARKVPGARYENILGPITNHGAYTDVVTVGGQPTLIREPDGVHLNIAGSDVVAGELTPVIAREWKMGVKQRH